MNKITECVRRSEEEFVKSELSKYCGACFECCDWEEIQTKFTEHLRESQESLIKSIIEELKENGVGICAHAYNNAIIDVKTQLLKSLEK